MTYYTTRQIREILGLSPGIVARLVEAGFVAPGRGPRREYRFSFQDLVVLRAAKGLSDARLSPRRILQSLKRLREQLPKDLPAAGLRIAAIGNSVAVIKGGDSWRADDGQYLLAFEIAAPQGDLVVLEKKEPAGGGGQTWFDQGCRLEDADPRRAVAHYRNALRAGICHSGIFTNLGRLLHEQGRQREAESVYREGVRRCPGDAVLRYNLAVLLDEQSRTAEAMSGYREALKLDPGMADAHYNLGLACEAAGLEREALRHFSACRKLRAKER